MSQPYPTIFAITQASLDLDDLLARITLPTTGAACFFTGMVRGVTRRGDPHETAYLEYEAYQPMAEAKMRQVAEEIRQRWPSVEGIAIVQRVGRLEAGTPTVLIACTAAHRDTGVFEAARYGIDRLKEIVPVWKKEVGPQGEVLGGRGLPPAPGGSCFRFKPILGIAMPIHCTNCSQPYPHQGVPYRCPSCGGLFDYSQPLAYDPARDRPAPAGNLALPPHLRSAGGCRSGRVSGEGNTPLVWAEAFGLPVAFKCEYLNPSASFKDRGSAVIAGVLRWRGVTYAVEDSSGNAGASFAAYAARAGVRARIFAPEFGLRSQRVQIEAYGAELVRVMGPRSNAANAVLNAVDAGAQGGEPVPAYASHAYLPFNLPGYATLAYELVDQMGGAPGSLVLPAGQGGLLLGIGRGFQALLAAGIIQQLPVLVGVQARACAPLWALYSYGPAGLGWVAEAPTLAEGIRVLQPLRGDAVLNTIAAHQGIMVAVDEDEILPGREALARRGLYVEPTSAVVWGALAQLVGKLPEPIAVVLTGSGLKAPPNTFRSG